MERAGFARRSPAAPLGGRRGRKNVRHYTIEQQVKEVEIRAPHLVVLGAGASRHAFPCGDAKGRRLPVMSDFVEVLGLGDSLRDHGVDVAAEDFNFEAFLSDLHESGENGGLLRHLESRIIEYFSALKLPETPTLYDYLLLGLRETDVVATFNWDPFLWKAANRNQHKIRPPHLLFLHGNVAVGLCQACKVKGDVSDSCHRCGKSFEPSRVLYPVKNKDYRSSPFIENEWRVLQQALEKAYVLTIFGYGAPDTDAAAVELLRSSWVRSRITELAEVEIIDVQPENTLRRKWADFIVRSHYRVNDDFYTSLIAQFPRRSSDAIWNQSMNLRILDRNPAPRRASFVELWNWHGRFVAAESQG